MFRLICRAVSHHFADSVDRNCKCGSTQTKELIRLIEKKAIISKMHPRRGKNDVFDGSSDGVV